MIGYRFRARSDDGLWHSGVIQAPNKEEVSRILERQGLVLDSVKREPLDRTLRLRRSVNAAALVQFYHQFAALIGAGIPLLRCLESMTQLTSDPDLKRAVDDVGRSVKEGATLADALRRHPRVFSEIAVSVIDSAEASGSIDVAMKRLADYVERTKAIRDNARAAMIYPGLIVLVTIGAVIALITFVVPTFESLFQASGVSLPLATRVLLSFSDLLTSYWPIMFVGFLLSILAGRAAYATPRVRLVMDRLVLKLPIFGQLMTKVAIARVSRTLASLLMSGVSILEALASASRTAGNGVIENALLQSRETVAKGMDLRWSLSRHPELPQLMSDMVGVGEESGSLDDMLGKVADFYEREVETEVQAILKVIEPTLIVLVGLVLAGLVVAMYLPIFDTVAAIDAM